MRREDPIKVMTWDIGRQGCRDAASCNEERLITKAIPSAQGDKFALSVDPFDTSVDYMDALGSLDSSRIREQLLPCQFPNGKLFEFRCIDGGGALLSDEDDGQVRGEAAGFYRSSKASNAITYNDNVCPLHFMLFIHCRHGSLPSHKYLCPFSPLEYAQPCELK